jgi:uncharacterized protein
MVTNPNFKIVANNKDVTATIKKNLVSLSFKDEANNNADELTIVVTDDFARPTYYDKLQLYLGYGNDLTFCGVFNVQSTNRNFKKSLTINATGVDFHNSLKERRSITYEKISVQGICEQIATRNSLQIKSDFSDVYFQTIAQHHESDLNFLNRLAYQLNAIFNIKNQTLIFTHKVKGNKQNTALPTYTIDVNECESFTVKHSNRTLYKSCKVQWHDTKTNQSQYVLSGSGEPCFIVTSPCATAAEAKIKADAKLQTENQGIYTGEITIAGKVVYAGGIITIINAGEDSKTYQITSVNHTFDTSGWKTRIEFKN